MDTRHGFIQHNLKVIFAPSDLQLEDEPLLGLRVAPHVLELVGEHHEGLHHRAARHVRAGGFGLDEQIVFVSVRIPKMFLLVFTLEKS